MENGNKICNKGNKCVTCSILIEGRKLRSSFTNEAYLLKGEVTCTTKMVIYLITCNYCRKQYVGKTTGMLKICHHDHRQNVKDKSSNYGSHFGEECGMQNMKIQIIEQCWIDELKEREGYWMKNLSTLSPDGMNVQEERCGGDKNTSTSRVRRFRQKTHLVKHQQPAQPKLK